MRITIVVFLLLGLTQACSTKPSATENPVEEKEVVKSEGLLLIESSDCQTCHHTTNKLVGPSYTAIATKYNESDEIVTMLSSKVITGGLGVWGDMPMNPHPSLSEEEAQKMVRYILTLDTLTQ